MSYLLAFLLIFSDCQLTLSVFLGGYFDFPPGLYRSPRKNNREVQFLSKKPARLLFAVGVYKPLDRAVDPV